MLLRACVCACVFVCPMFPMHSCLPLCAVSSPWVQAKKARRDAAAQSAAAASGSKASDAEKTAKPEKSTKVAVRLHCFVCVCVRVSRCSRLPPPSCLPLCAVSSPWVQAKKARRDAAISAAAAPESTSVTVKKTAKADTAAFVRWRDTPCDFEASIGLVMQSALYLSLLPSSVNCCLS